MDNPTISSPAFALYGDGRIFPDVLHCEAITTRAARHDWKIGRHRHPGLHQFFLIASGAVTVQLASGDRVLLPPVTISMPSKLDHGFVFDAGTVGVVVSVPVAVLAGLAAQGLNRLHIAPAAPRTEAIFTALSSWHADPGGLRDVALRALVTALACDLIHGDAGGFGAPPTLFKVRGSGQASRCRRLACCRLCGMSGHICHAAEPGRAGAGGSIGHGRSAGLPDGRGGEAVSLHPPIGHRAGL
jgi:hypothetical protein